MEVSYNIHGRAVSKTIPTPFSTARKRRVRTLERWEANVDIYGPHSAMYRDQDIIVGDKTKYEDVQEPTDKSWFLGWVNKVEEVKTARKAVSRTRTYQKCRMLILTVDGDSTEYISRLVGEEYTKVFDYETKEWSDEREV